MDALTTIRDCVSARDAVNFVADVSKLELARRTVHTARSRGAIVDKARPTGVAGARIPLGATGLAE